MIFRHRHIKLRKEIIELIKEPLNEIKDIFGVEINIGEIAEKCCHYIY